MTPKLLESISRFHKTGYMRLALDPTDETGKSFFSCGKDESIIKWEHKTETSFEPDVFVCDNKFHGNIAVNKDVFVGETVLDVLSEDYHYFVNKYDSTTKFMFDILQFSSPITALDVSPDGRYILAGAEDYFLKGTHINQGWDVKEDLDGAAVSISFSHSSDAVVVGCNDGFIITYSVDEDGLTERLKLKITAPFNVIDDVSNRLQCAWHPFDSKLYVPSSNSIIIVNTKEWKKDKTLDTNGEEVSILCISKNGQYLAGYTQSNKVYVYQTAGPQLLSTVDLKGRRIVSMIFDPDNNKNLIMADTSGMCSIIQNAASLQLEDEPLPQKIASIEKEKDFDKVSDDFVGDDDKDAFNFDDEDDIGAIKSRYDFDSSSRPAVSAPAPQIPPELLKSLKRPLCTVTKMMPPASFVSGSTPFRNGERFLKWNTYGQIRVAEINQEVFTEVQFHDVTIHPEIVINDLKFSMGDLNNHLIALASETELYVRLVNSLNLDNRVWTLQMPEGEAIENIAVGSDFVAVYTHERYVRIFTASGTQRHIFSAETPVVSMAAHEKLLVLAAVSGGVIVHSEENYEHQLNLTIYEINALGGRLPVLKKRGSSAVALSPEASLKWLSFSSSGQICSMDSDFVVRLLSTLNLNFWIPIFEGSSVLKNETSGFWPIAVMDSSIHLTAPKIRYLICKGSDFPVPSKKLAPHTMALSLPLCDKETKKTEDENELILAEIMLAAKQVNSENTAADLEDINKLAQKHLQCVLKLFRNAMDSKENRAAEFVEITHGPKGVNMLRTLAAKNNKRGLSEILTKVAEKRFAVDSNKPSTHQDVAPSKRTIKRRTVPTQNEVEFGEKSSKLIRKSVEDSQDVYSESQMETDEAPSTFNDSTSIFSLNESIVEAGPCNPFKKTLAATQNSTASRDNSQDFFATLTATTRSTTSDASNSSNNVQIKKNKTQPKLSFHGTQQTEFKENDS